MKHTKRILCLLLALLMLLPLAVACNKKGDGGKGDGAETSDVAGGNAAGNAAASGDGSDESGEQIETDENGFQKDSLDGLDFGGKELYVLACSDPMYKELDISVDDMNASELNRALYTRDLKVKSRLNVKPVYQQVPRDEVAVEAQAMETQGDVDLYAPYSRLSATLMMQGYTRNLLDVNHLDFSGPWWSRDLLNKVTIHDRMYVASGDISPSLFGATYVICFNKTLFDEVEGGKLANYDAESLYEMVEEGTWTLDAMLDFAKGVGLGTDDGKDIADSYGFVCDPVHVDSLYQAMGLKVLDYNPDSSVKVSEDLYSAKAHGVVEKLNTFFDSPDGLMPDYGDGPLGDRNAVSQSFINGTSLFKVDVIGAVGAMLQNVDVGILPLPKYNADQERYYDVNMFAYLVWSISRSVTDDTLDACGAFMECMASEGYRTIAPAMYEDVYKGQSSESAEDYAMWDTIRDSIDVEGGRLFVDVFENKTYSVFRTAIVGRTTDYMSHSESYREQMNGYADGLNNLMLTLEDLYA